MSRTRRVGLAPEKRGQRVLRDVRRLVELEAQGLGGVEKGQTLRAEDERTVDDRRRVAAAGTRRATTARPEQEGVETPRPRPYGAPRIIVARSVPQCRPVPSRRRMLTGW